MFKHLQSLIDGSVTIAKRAHLDCGAHFIAKGYKQIIPGQAEDEPR